MEYAKEIEIDQHNLDYEIICQPSLYLKYSELSIDAGFVKDKLKEQIKVLEGNLYLEVKNDHEHFGLGAKPTEGAVKACITTQPEVIKLNQEYMEAVKVYNSLNGAKVALEHKKKSLELLTSLIIRGYSAEPKVEKEFTDNKQKEGHRVLNSKLSKNKRILKKKGE